MGDYFFKTFLFTEDWYCYTEGMVKKVNLEASMKYLHNFFYLQKIWIYHNCCIKTFLLICRIILKESRNSIGAVRFFDCLMLQFCISVGSKQGSRPTSFAMYFLIWRVLQSWPPLIQLQLATTPSPYIMLIWVLGKSCDNSC